MRVLITGAGGFLGAAVARALLARADTVVAFDKTLAALADLDDKRLILAPGDITDMANVAHAMAAYGPDAVLHCAAVVGVLSSLGSPINVVRVNIEGALNVFEAMRLAGVRRCINISSEEVYGIFRGDRIDETHPLEPMLPYGISKAAVEHFARTYQTLHRLEVIHLRTSWVYGAGLPRERIPKTLIDAALEGRPLHLESGAQAAIDHTYVDDVVTAVLAALDHEAHRYDAYNVASGKAVTVAELVALVRELIPGAQLSVGSGPYRHGDAVEMGRKGALDVSRAHDELGWRPAYDIRRGLQAYIDAQRRAHSTRT